MLQPPGRWYMPKVYSSTYGAKMSVLPWNQSDQNRKSQYYNQFLKNYVTPEIFMIWQPPCSLEATVVWFLLSIGCTQKRTGLALSFSTYPCSFLHTFICKGLAGNILQTLVRGVDSPGSIYSLWSGASPRGRRCRGSTRVRVYSTSKQDLVGVITHFTKR